MTLGSLLIFGALVAVVIGIAHFMAIVSFLRRRGVKINWFLLKLYMPKYVSQYRGITLRETGETGPLFYGFILGMNGALALGILGFLIR